MRELLIEELTWPPDPVLMVAVGAAKEGGFRTLNLSNLSSKFLFSRHFDFHEIACSQDVPSIIAVGILGRNARRPSGPEQSLRGLD